MKLIIGIYDFEYDDNYIHICENRNNRRKYFDFIRVENKLGYDEFKGKCKNWYFENELCV